MGLPYIAQEDNIRNAARCSCSKSRTVPKLSGMYFPSHSMLEDFQPHLECFGCVSKYTHFVRWLSLNCFVNDW